MRPFWLTHSIPCKAEKGWTSGMTVEYQCARGYAGRPFGCPKIGWWFLKMLGRWLDTKKNIKFYWWCFQTLDGHVSPCYIRTWFSTILFQSMDPFSVVNFFMTWLRIGSLPMGERGGTKWRGYWKMTGWWFQIFFIFTPTWGRFIFWLIFFKWVETTK